MFRKERFNIYNKTFDKGKNQRSCWCCYQSDEKEAFWLGWFCVSPKERGKRIGYNLLKFAVEKAKIEGKKYLRLWSSTNPNEDKAHKLYENVGFVKLQKEEILDNTEYKKIFFELEL